MVTYAFKLVVGDNASAELETKRLAVSQEAAMRTKLPNLLYDS